VGGVDRLAAPGRDVGYRLTASGRARLERLGVELPRTDDRELALRYCVDWSEQAHHLSGGVGRALAARLFALGWLARLPYPRAVRLTPAGERGLRDALGLGEDALAA
jgi:hypothetical protein